MNVECNHSKISHIILNVCKQYLVKIRKLQKVAVAMHCNLRLSNVAPMFWTLITSTSSLLVQDFHNLLWIFPLRYFCN